MMTTTCLMLADWPAIEPQGPVAAAAVSGAPPSTAGPAAPAAASAARATPRSRSRRGLRVGKDVVICDIHRLLGRVSDGQPADGIRAGVPGAAQGRDGRAGQADVRVPGGGRDRQV